MGGETRRSHPSKVRHRIKVGKARDGKESCDFARDAVGIDESTLICVAVLPSLEGQVAIAGQTGPAESFWVHRKAFARSWR